MYDIFPHRRGRSELTRLQLYRRWLWHMRRVVEKSEYVTARLGMDARKAEQPAFDEWAFVLGAEFRTRLEGANDTW